MNPDGLYDDPETEALLAETGVELARAPPTELPGLPADYRVGNT